MSKPIMGNPPHDVIEGNPYRTQLQTVSDEQQMAMKAMKESVLREIKEMGDIVTSLNHQSPTLSKGRRRGRVLGRSKRQLPGRKNSSSASTSNIGKMSDHSDLSQEMTKSELRRAHRSNSTGDLNIMLEDSPSLLTSQVKRSQKKSAGKKVLNVASLPFRHVKRRFTTQTSSGSEKPGNVRFDGQCRDSDEMEVDALKVDDSEQLVDDSDYNNAIHTANGHNHSIREYVTRSMNPVSTLLSGLSQHESVCKSLSQTPTIRNPSLTDTDLGFHTASNTNHSVNGETLHNESLSSDVNGNAESVVNQLESLLRLLCCLFFAYFLGMRFPEYSVLVLKVGEYACVSWATCILLLVATKVKRNKNESRHQSRHKLRQEQQQIHKRQAREQSVGNLSPLEGRKSDETSSDEEEIYDFFDDAVDEDNNDNRIRFGEKEGDDDTWLASTDDEFIGRKQVRKRGRLPSSPDLFDSGPENEVPDNAESLEWDKYGYSDADKNGGPNPSMQRPTQSTIHPSLKPLYVIDKETTSRIYANSSVAYPLETEYFKGQMMILIRTPNVDVVVDKGNSRRNLNVPTSVEIEPGDVEDNYESDNAAASNFFENKLRRFEFQFQVQLKRVPTGRVFFACELSDSVKLGMIQQAFVGAAMAFVKSTNKSFHYSLAGTPVDVNGTDPNRYEAPHMAFPVEEGMNRVVATPPGQPLPVLGEEIIEDPESIKQRKKGIRLVYNTTDTYTFSLWSQYVDFLDWRCLNLPGIRPFSISSVIGPQPILLTLYEVNDMDSVSNKPLEKHYKSEMTNIVALELCNSIKSTMGPATRKWKLGKKQEKQKYTTRNENMIPPMC